MKWHWTNTGSMLSKRLPVFVRLESSNMCRELQVRMYRTIWVYNAEGDVGPILYSHRLTAYKIVGNFFGLSSREKSRKIFFLESVTFQFHVRMLSSKVTQSLKSYKTFFELWGRDRSQSPPCWIFRIKQINQSTVSERTTRLTLICTSSDIAFMLINIQ